MKWSVVESIANDQEPDWRINLLHEFVFEEARDRDMSSASGQIPFEIGKEPFIGAFDEDFDFASAAKSSSCIEAHERWLAASQNFARASRHFFFDAAGAQRTDHYSIFANQHPRAGPAITRAFHVYQGRQRKTFAAPLLPLMKNV